MVQPPSARLPPIAKIATFTSTQLSDALQYLYALYLPQVRGSRRRRRDEKCVDNGEDIQLVQSDAFERAYAIRWLTALIAQLDSPTPDTDADCLIQQAASLLATCAGVAAAGKVQRRFTFPSTVAGGIHITLTDIPLDNRNYASVGAQTWGGACVLAEMIAEHPDRFGLTSPRHSTSDRLSDCPRHTYGHPLRILELGAGTGLVGLTVAKLLQASPLKNASSIFYHRATIVLTDFYPAVLDNLQSNISTNFPAISDDTILVSCHSLDWSSFSATETISDIFSMPFDVVFGADIVYEAQHAVWIYNCLNSLLAHPDISHENPVFHLVIPLRSTHALESSTVEEVFGPKNCLSHPELTILSKELIVCEAYPDGMLEGSHADDDVEYVYYRIGWTR